MRDQNTAEATLQTMMRRHRRFIERSPRASRRGASLVEVLVVLVIILIGVFSVIRIFPIGFGTLRQSERRLRATRLATNFNDQTASNAANLPEAVTFSYWASAAAASVTVTDIDPDDMGVYQNDPANKLYFSDINKFRYIQNEPVKIPQPTSTFNNFSQGSLYQVRFGPIYMDNAVGNPANAPSAAQKTYYDSYLKVTGEPLTATVVDSANGTDSNYSGLLRPGGTGYFIDYGRDGGGARIMLPPASRAVGSTNANRTYTIRYTYEVSGGANNTTIESSIMLPAEAAPRWQLLPLPAGATATDGVVPGSDIVTIDFQRIGSASPFDPGEPYQYKLASANISNYANYGLIAFNPAGANFSEDTPYGQRVLTARVSYAVLDWHILKDDIEVPEGIGGIAKIRTSLPNILPKGEELPDSTEPGGVRVYNGLYPELVANNPNQRAIEVFNLSDPTGVPLAFGDYEQRTGAHANRDYWISEDGRGGTYPTGTLYINTERLPVGTRLRVLYKAQGEWGVALQKAVSTYIDVTDGGTRPGRPAATGGSTSHFTRADQSLYFHITELNKSVTLSLEYDIAGPNGGTQTVRVPAQQLTISDIDPNDGTYARLNLARYIPAAATGWRIANNEVKGVSVKTRVVYKDNASFRNPWRIQDVETFLTRSNGLN